MGKDIIVPRDFRRELLMELSDVSSKRCALAYHDTEVDMSTAIRVCSQFRERGIELTHIHLLIKAAAAAISENPIFNSILTRSGIKILEKVIVAVTNGVPARLPLVLLEDAHAKSLEAIVRELESSAKVLATNEPKFLKRLDSLHHLPRFLSSLVIRCVRSYPHQSLRELLPTFFVANLGTADSGFPLYGTTAYLVAGRIAERPLLVDGELTVRPTMCLGLVTDHRIIDGVPAGAFLNRVKELMEGGG